ncbi:MAG: hypothetical protein CMJ78_26290 [Planctomycetaceae bacterium]|nr:hypothetical protein [Planctomycetaceae bacterium]
MTNKVLFADKIERRQFLKSSLAAALPFATAPALATDSKKRPDVCVYTEHFQSLPIPEVCGIFKQLGVEGLDLTVRPGGHIPPEKAKAELPKAVQAAKDHGLKIMMLTTAINSADRNAEEILATCQQEGIDRIKTGYFPIGQFGQLKKRLVEVRKQLDQVVELAAKYKVRPCIHVHSGSTIPSNGFMLYNLIRDIPPERVGAYLDSYHMTITGGAGGWRQAIDLLTPWISLVALKNFQWHPGKRTDINQQTWRTEFCRLEDGIAPIPSFVNIVQRVGYQGFYTLHTEYRKPVKDCIQLTKEDFAYLKRIFARL